MASETQAQAPLAGVVLCCSGLPSEQRDRVHRISRELGAKTTFDLTTENTHLVIADPKTPKYKYVAKERPDMVVVITTFIEAIRESWLAGGQVDIRQYEFEHRAPALRGLSITLTGFTEVNERAEIIKKIQDNGAKYEGDLSKYSTTHLIAKTPSGKKYFMAPKWDIKVVSQEWLDDSIERGMTLDETLYDLNLALGERGKNAWNRNFVPEPNSPGKRTREEDSTFHGEGRRKIRRTMSTKLSGAQDSIWADITAAPAPKTADNEWTDDGMSAKVVITESFIVPRQFKPVEQQPEQVVLKKTFQRAPGSLFQGTSIYIHLFDPVKTLILQDHLSSNGATVYKTRDIIDIDDIRPDHTSYLLVPSDTELGSLHIPMGLKNLPQVTEWWLETCLHERRPVQSNESPLLQPFFKRAIPEFQFLVICSTGMEGTSRLQLSRAVTSLGAKYEETVKEGVSVLISGTNVPRLDRARGANRLNIPIVHVDWLWDCVSSHSVVPFESHLLTNGLSKSQTHKEPDIASFETTRTLSVPSDVLERRMSEHSKSARSKEDSMEEYVSAASLPLSNQSSKPHSTNAPDQENKPESNTATNQPPRPITRNPISRNHTDTSQPLQEVPAERLNSPTKSASPEKASEEQTSSKPNQLTSALTEMLAAKRAARPNAPSGPHAEDTSMARRKRGGLGRATSNNLDVSRSPSQTMKSTELAVRDDDDNTVVANVLLSQRLVYEDADARLRHQKLLSEMNGAAKSDDDVLEISAQEANQAGETTTTAVTRRSKRTPARARGRKRN